MDEQVAATFAQRVDWLIARMNVTRKRLAELAGVSAATLALAVKSGSPSPNTVYRLAKATGAREEWLLTGAGEPFARDNVGTVDAAVRPSDAVRYFAVALGLRPAVVDAVVAQALPDTAAAELLARIRVADADSRLRARAPSVAAYEAAAAFARANGISSDSIVAVREQALAGGFSSPLQCFFAMGGAPPAPEAAPPAAARAVFDADELKRLGYDRPRHLRASRAKGRRDE